MLAVLCHGPQAAKNLARTLHCSRTTIYQSSRRLEARGLVRRIGANLTLHQLAQREVVTVTYEGAKVTLQVLLQCTPPPRDHSTPRPP